MTSPAFVSYARKDSEFALRLAEDLKANGANVWLDQLDIRPGQQWDAEVERALGSCSKVLVILSPASVDSRNVMDEVAFALDEGKIVIPVLQGDCRIPFRLRRLQYVDFSPNYERGIEALLRALEPGERSAVAAAAVQGAAAPVKTLDEHPAPPAVKPFSGTDESGRSRRGAWWRDLSVPVWIPAGAAAVALAVGLVKTYQTYYRGQSAPLEREAKAKPSEPKFPIPGPQVNPEDGLGYVWIPPGSFVMGCSLGDNECRFNEPSKNVAIPSGFWLGRTEVTQAAWKKVMKSSNPSSFEGDQLPVESVDWNQAAAYCKAIGGRLPTEEEWEYAARAGTTGALYDSLDAIAWYSVNSNGSTHPVGRKQANAWGLYDMLGNVWEWTSSDYDTETKLARGGSWYNDATRVRASDRVRSKPTQRDEGQGFRCVWEFR